MFKEAILLLLYMFHLNYDSNKFKNLNISELFKFIINDDIYYICNLNI